MDFMMKIDCYISTRCASEVPLRNNVSEALALEGVEADVRVHLVDDEKAAEMGLRGSPSVFVNGVEVQPIATGGFA
jgi:hypothetical protein